MWKLLDKQYGDKEVGVLSATHRLVSMKIPQGPAHNKVEAFMSGVRTARS